MRWVAHNDKEQPEVKLSSGRKTYQKDSDQPSGMIFVKKELEGSKFLAALLGRIGCDQVKFSASLVPHLLLPSFVTPLAVSLQFVRDEEGLPVALEHLCKVQKGFRQSCGILITRDNGVWAQANLSMPGGLLRLLRAQNFDETVSLVCALHEEMSGESTTNKMKGQANFFRAEQDKLRSQAMAAKVYRQWLHDLDVCDEADVALLGDGFPSLKALARAPFCALAEASPVDADKLRHIAHFFACMK